MERLSIFSGLQAPVLNSHFTAGFQLHVAGTPFCLCTQGQRVRWFNSRPSRTKSMSCVFRSGITRDFPIYSAFVRWSWVPNSIAALSEPCSGGCWKLSELALFPGSCSTVCLAEQTQISPDRLPAQGGRELPCGAFARGGIFLTAGFKPSSFAVGASWVTRLRLNNHLRADYWK